MPKIVGETGAHRVHKGTQQRATATDGSIVERGDNGRVYRYVPEYDHTIIEINGTATQPLKGNQLPSQNAKPENSIDSYIDTVLEKSGMTNAKQTPNNAPTPTSRPNYNDEQDVGQPMIVEATPEEISAAQAMGVDSGNGDGTGDGGEGVLNALGIAGGAGAAGITAKMLYDYMAQTGADVEGENTTQKTDRVTDQTAQQMVEGPNNNQPMITAEERLMIEGPRNQITQQ